MKSARNYVAPYTVNSFRDYLAGSATTLATCWKLVAKDGSVVASTSHTRDLTLPAHGGITFLSSGGVIPSTVDNEVGLTSSGLEVDAVFKVDIIDEESVAAGDWDSSYFEVFLINYSALDMGELVMFAGYIGEVKTYGQRFRAEGRPLTVKSTQEIGQLYTPKCVARNLGDGQCKINLLIPAGGDAGVITVTGTVTSSGSNIDFGDTARKEPTGYFDFGVIQFTSGILNGKMSEIRSFSGTGVSVVNRMASDHTWKWNASNPAGWNNAGFDDSAWGFAVEEGVNGQQPWGTITTFPSDSTGQWIWSDYSVNTPSPSSVTKYIRKKFTPNVASAVLSFVGDDTVTAYVNGVSVGTGTDWHMAQSVNITLTPNVENVIAFSVVNLGSGTSATNPAGVMADVKFAAYNPTGNGGTFSLQTAMTRLIPIGTTYTAIRGCDRTFDVCKRVYNNTINFRGYPFVPGIEKAYKINQTG